MLGKQFKSVIEKFNVCSNIGDQHKKSKPGENIPLADFQTVKDFFDANKEAIFEEASLD